MIVVMNPVVITYQDDTGSNESLGLEKVLAITLYRGSGRSPMMKYTEMYAGSPWCRLMERSFVILGELKT